MKQTVILMCGIPGSGKSYFVQKNAKTRRGSCVFISRDEIRKELVGDNVTPEKYFSREDEVFNQFKADINHWLALGMDNVYVDATHINAASRAKILRQIDNRKNLNLEVRVMMCDELTAQKRNAKRTGFAKVPAAAIKRMHSSFRAPTYEELEKFGFKNVKIYM